jgi:hypothetical protein
VTAEILDRDEVVRDFHQAVNMTPSELTRWLDTEDSKAVGWKGEDGQGSGESVGHRSGRRIVELLGIRKADLSDDDLHHMRKVIGYVHRHLAQGPSHDAEHSRWRYSLMNWGHDPAKGGSHQ